jgi:hypothetical protein
MPGHFGVDDIVRAALVKWPNVPHCTGWLALDARGDWYLRDDAAQAGGPFPYSRGSRLEHVGLREFIGRNYASDEGGAWFFQNGPQRVFVELEVMPWVWRLNVPVPSAESADGQPQIHSHTGIEASYRSTCVDEHGRVFIETDLGWGLVHTLDVGIAADAVERGCWEVADKSVSDLIEQAGICLSPARRAKAPA